MPTAMMIKPGGALVAATMLMLASIIPAAAQTSVATPMAPSPPPLAGSLTSTLQGVTSAPEPRKAEAAQPAAPAPQAASPAAAR